MKNLTAISTIMFGGALSFGSSTVMAHTIGVEYATEWQTNFKGGYDWLNLLKTTVDVPLYRGLSFQGSTISTAKTGEETLIDDLQTYSNIEAGNIPLTFARLGFAWANKGAELFVGINNVNEDYFTSDMTSFFTNSSCGISPTISCNYDIANYPLAAWCLHYRQQMGSVSVQTSLYPGAGYSRLLGHDNLFSLNLKRDGIFSISSIDYKRNGIYCILGVALHYGYCTGDENAEQMEAHQAASQKTFSTSPWLLTEIELPHNLGLHAHVSVSTVKEGCKSYAGVGLLYSGKRLQPGLALNYAHFTYASEYSVELACRIPVYSDIVSLQPALHLVSVDHSKLSCVGMFRLYLAI